MDDLFTRIGAKLTKRSRRSPVDAAPVPYTRGSNGVASLFNAADDIPLGEKAYEAYGSTGTLFAIVFQIMNAFASVDWHLYKRTSIRDKTRRNEIITHPFLSVWNKPNDFYTGRFFRECCQQHLDLVGETVILLVSFMDIIYEMWPVRPDRIKPVKDPKKFLLGYIYCAPDGEEVPLRLEDVLHIKYPNPADPYRGMGPVQTMLYDIDAAKFSAMWNRNFFINGAQPGGVIEFEYRMGDKEWEAFIQRWRQTHQGVANAHRVAVLEGAHWKDTKFTMEDMQFTELRNLPRELIREAFAFPKPMLGTVDDVNRANALAGKEIMAEGQTIPRLSRWKDSIDNYLLPRFANGQTLELEPDDPTPVNKDVQNAERNSQATAALQLTLAGYHPDDILETVGLPPMRYVGLPAVQVKETDAGAAPVNPNLPSGTETPQQLVLKARAERIDYWRNNMPLLLEN